MDIKILGMGCSKCNNTEDAVRKVVEENNIDATIGKVDDFAEIAKYGVMKTPAVVVDGKVVVYGKVPSVKEIQKFLGV